MSLIYHTSGLKYQCVPLHLLLLTKSNITFFWDTVEFYCSPNADETDKIVDKTVKWLRRHHLTSNTSLRSEKY